MGRHALAQVTMRCVSLRIVAKRGILLAGGMVVDAVRFFTVNEVAKLCKVKPCTVRGWLLRKRLRKHKAHGRVLVSEHDLAYFIKADPPEVDAFEAVA